MKHREDGLFYYSALSFLAHMVLVLIFRFSSRSGTFIPVSEVSLFYGSSGLSESYAAVETPEKEFEFLDRKGMPEDISAEDIHIKADTGRPAHDRIEKTTGIEWNFGFRGKRFKGFDRSSEDIKSEGAANIIGPAGRRKVLRSFYPGYPGWAKKEGVSGVVEIKFWVDAAGLVSRAEVSATSGDNRLDSDAVAAIKKWLFDSIKKQEDDWGSIRFIYKLK